MIPTRFQLRLVASVALVLFSFTWASPAWANMIPMPEGDPVWKRILGLDQFGLWGLVRALGGLALSLASSTGGFLIVFCTRRLLGRRKTDRRKDETPDPIEPTDPAAQPDKTDLPVNREE